MPAQTANNRTFDARPDRIDLRDRQYSPPLVSLPGQYPDVQFIASQFPLYAEQQKLILDQGQEGACTGFGLAAVVNYLLWKNNRDNKTFSLVSARMLYHMARIYDEWPGEDYEGSSCRGAMKGWHHHGVCIEKLWPYRDKAGRIRFIKPKEGWQQDAASRPLGAYYRINKNSIADMQAAIYEVGAIYVSASVHNGWFIDKSKSLPVMKYPNQQAGGHAFAMVGYTSKGFIVQNSWGPDWGYFGFAVMSYEDWIQNGSDAWVAAMGAPMEVGTAGRSISSKSLRDVSSGKAEWFWQSDKKKSYVYRNKSVMPWSENLAYEHTLVLGNNGHPLNRLLDQENASIAASEIICNLPLQWLKENNRNKIVVYAHGGLNTEEDSINRIRVMAPYFKANGVYPLFISWQTGFIESIRNLLDDAAQRYLQRNDTRLATGWWSDQTQAVREAIDRSIETAADSVLIKPVWSQMKQNAVAAMQENAGLTLLAQQLADLHKSIPDLEIHLAGHSAGSILLGHLLTLLGKKKVLTTSLHLYAPACTVEFACQTFVPAVKKGQLNGAKLFCDVLSDEREQADSVGPYGKSLLYLVSRALEDRHKMPLLGFEAVWNPETEREDMWNSSQLKSIEKWREFSALINAVQIHGKERSKVWDGQQHINLDHGSFDNDIDVVSRTLERITGDKLKVKVENLHWD